MQEVKIVYRPQPVSRHREINVHLAYPCPHSQQLILWGKCQLNERITGPLV